MGKHATYACDPPEAALLDLIVEARALVDASVAQQARRMDALGDAVGTVYAVHASTGSAMVPAEPSVSPRSVKCGPGLQASDAPVTARKTR